MRRLLGSLALFLVFAGAASAAEMPVKALPVYKAPPPPPVATWTGFYIGGNFGYGVGRARSVVAESDGTVDFDSRLSPAGIIGGGQAGYRLQRDWLVIGAEADFQWSNQRNTLCFFSPTQGCSHVFNIYHGTFLNWFGTVRGIAGIAQNNWLWYVTGGFAYGRVEDEAGDTSEFGDGRVAAGGTAVTLTGWTAGGGVETRLWGSNWSAKLEYLYVDLGHLAYIPPCAGQITNLGMFLGCNPPPTQIGSTVNTAVTNHVFRVGLNYNFGGSTLVASRAMPATTGLSNWAGFYVGANMGYGVGHDRLDIERFPASGAQGPIFSVPQSPAGFVGGVQAGYRFQRDWLVIGAEADVQKSRWLDSSCSVCPGVDILYDVKRDWFGTVRGVVGVAQNNWLWYVTGGYAYGRVAVHHETRVGPILASSNSTQDGWTAGVGVETRLWASQWSAKLEYLYVDLGNVSFDATCSERAAHLFGLQVGRCEGLTNSATDHIMRVGLNYRFGSP